MPIPPYVAALRARIGTDLLWLPGVTALVLDAAGEHVLLGRRADSGRWALISGILDPGEEPAVGIVREVREETGVDVTVEALASVTVTEPHRYPNGDLAQYLDLCFVCRPVDAAAADRAHVADDESLEVAWFAWDDVPGDLTETSVVRLRLAREFLLRQGAGPAFGTGAASG
ncbi:NUDIX domain-containing protein [Mumia zhuanghuii]|uniref:NUDIX domain-containing protein n=2 Tax=Mumia TaxID=1546255 RepID=A0ABW1QG71_9ACTN|nr:MULTISPECIES: NUDIX domain-containing protein [Mumia]KAA1424742.1 NUDIX domain-containing protein [Mumia zhuanghuii]